MWMKMKEKALFFNIIQIFSKDSGWNFLIFHCCYIGYNNETDKPPQKGHSDQKNCLDVTFYFVCMPAG